MMTLHFTLLSLLLQIVSSYTQPSQGNTFTLGSNRISNPQISSPTVAPFPYKNFKAPLNGWQNIGSSIEYIDACINSYYADTCQTYLGVTCGWQFLDADSYQHNEIYYQNFTLTKGREFRVMFDYVSEVPGRNKSTGLSVLWNNQTIISFYDDSCVIKTMILYVISVDGVNQLAFRGEGIADSAGIMIRNVWMQQLYYPYIPPIPPALPAPVVIPISLVWFSTLKARINNPQYSNIFTVYDYLINSTFGTIANSFTAKQNIRFVLGYILQFNHFLLYNYHIRNYTLASNVILAGMQALDDAKGNLLDSLIYPLMKTNATAVNIRFLRQNNLNINIMSVVPEYQHRKNGILLQITDALLLDLPITIVLFSLGFLCFQVLFHKRISFIFRQYSLICYFIFLFMDGRIEIMTFYFISELQLLISSSFLHKLQVVAIIYGYFFLFFFAMTSMILYRSAYGKLIKHVFHNCKKPIESTFQMTLSFGIFNILLGFIHRVLLPYPLVQLYILIIVEMAYLSYMAFLLFRRFYRNVLLAISLCLMNAARLAFVLSMLVYSYMSNSEHNIGKAQQYIFYSFVGLWGISSLICFFEKGKLAFSIFRSSFFSNKVAPIKGDSKALTRGKQRETVKVTNLRSEGEITSFKHFIEPKSKQSHDKTKAIIQRKEKLARPKQEEKKFKETKASHPKKC